MNQAAQDMRVSPQMLVACLPVDHGKDTNVFIASCELEAAYQRVCQATRANALVSDSAHRKLRDNG